MSANERRANNRWSSTFAIFAGEAALAQQPKPSWLLRFWGVPRGFQYFADGDFVVFDQGPDSLTAKHLPLPSLAVAFADPNWRPTDPKPTVAPALEAGRWFVRWALFSEQGAYREAFWRFVRAATLQPRIDDAFLQKNLGLTLAELDTVVGKFRRTSQAKTNLRFKLPLAPGTPAPVVRDATDVEIARILSQWSFVAARQTPRLNVPLHAAARRLLNYTRKTSDDPQLTALLGLVELAAGDLTKASALLESVATSPALDLRSRFELGRLRYLEASTKLTKPVDTLTAQQVSAILTPLAPFFAHAPGAADPLALIAQTWLRAATPPTRDELTAFAALARQFPRDDRLLLQTALLCSQQNLDALATELITTGIANSTNEQVRGALAQLQQRLTARAAP